MFVEQRGSIHTIVLILVVLVGFGAALGWPQYKKHQTIRVAKHALELGKEIAFAEATYKTKYGAYTPDFTQLNVTLPCPVEKSEGQTEMVCPHYVYRLVEGNILRVKHVNLPKWFDLNLDEGSVDCSHEESSIAGSHICGRVDVSDLVEK